MRGKNFCSANTIAFFRKKTALWFSNSVEYFYESIFSFTICFALILSPHPGFIYVLVCYVHAINSILLIASRGMVRGLREKCRRAEPDEVKDDTVVSTTNERRLGTSVFSFITLYYAVSIHETGLK